MKIVCQQTILVKYHALYVIFEKVEIFWNCRLLQIKGGALWVNLEIVMCNPFIYAMRHLRSSLSNQMKELRLNAIS